MAAPYLLLSMQPAWLKFLPKPGNWMITFKQAAGFVLLATAVWLLWILAAQLDAQGVVWTVAFWGFLSVSAWLLGKTSPSWNTGPRVVTWAAALLIALAGGYFCFAVMYDFPFTPWTR
jgi:thiol:disulfide interchange protein DsbD